MNISAQTSFFLSEWMSFESNNFKKLEEFSINKSKKKKKEVSTNCLYVAVSAISDNKLTTGIQSFSYLLARLTCIETNMAA